LCTQATKCIRQTHDVRRRNDPPETNDSMKEKDPPSPDRDRGSGGGAYRVGGALCELKVRRCCVRRFRVLYTTVYIYIHIYIYKYKYI